MTKRVICRLPNASTNINGIDFEPTTDGMLSVPVEDDVAALFDGIPGYEILEDGGKKAAGDGGKKAPAKPAANPEGGEQQPPAA